MSTGALLKRLEALTQSIRVRHPKWIMMLIDGNLAEQSAADAIVEALGVTPDDTVLYLARYSDTDHDLPRLGGITHF